MFVFVFNDTLDDGTKLSRSRVKIMKKIARIFRDEDTRHIVLSKVDPVTLEVAAERVVKLVPFSFLVPFQHMVPVKEYGGQ